MRLNRHASPVAALTRSHQLAMPSSFAVVPYQTRPLVSIIQLTLPALVDCTTTQSG
jgi:hypothetical protein